MFGFTKNDKEKAELILSSVGGKENILGVESCATRLRIELKNIDKVNREKALTSGAKEVIFIGEDMVHIVLGPKVDSVKNEFMELIK